MKARLLMLLLSGIVASGSVAQSNPYAPVRPPPRFPSVPPDQALLSLQRFARGEIEHPVHGSYTSIAATGDSATYWAPIEELAYAFAASDEWHKDQLVTNAMYVLAGLGADRAYFRSFALNPQVDPYLAAGALGVLAADPRAEEYDDLRHLSRLVFDSRIDGAGLFLSAASDYMRSFRHVQHYESLIDVDSKVRYLMSQDGDWSTSRLRELYLQDPGGVEAVVQQIGTGLPSTPVGPIPPDTPTVPVEWIRDEIRQVYLAPAGAVLPAQLPGVPPFPIAVPRCAGQPATIYVDPAGLVVGGPLDGQPYAGVLEGTDGDDVLVGTAGPDLIFGHDGDDLLCGAAGPDALDGGTGVNTLDGGPGTDGCDNGATTNCEGPVPTLRRVEPVADCVIVETTSYTAYFGYINHDGHPGTIAHGANNRMLIRPLNTLGEESELRPLQPAWFAVPGRVAGEPNQTPPYPMSAFAVTVPTNVSVVWHLLGPEAELTPDSPPCPVP